MSDTGVGERERIIDAAYQCLAEPHVGPVSVAAVLARANCSSRAFYRHFESKDALYVALIEREAAILSDRLDRIVAEHDGSPVELLQAWVEEMFALVFDPASRRHMRVIDSDEVRSARGYREVREQAHAHRERSLQQVLQRGLDDGSMPLADPDCDAVAVSAVVARILLSQPNLTEVGFRVGVEYVMDFALRAVGAVEERSRRQG